MPELPLHFVFFPGMIVHELSHYVACELLGVKVSKVKLFGSKEAFVEHAKPNPWQAVVITLAPFFLCNFFAFLLFVSALEQLNALNPVSIILFWLAFSLALFSFPSSQDATNSFGSFIDFYNSRIFGKTSLLLKLFWIILFPFFFVPLVLVLGTMLVFDYSVILRFVWAIILLVFSIDQSFLPGVVSTIMQKLLFFF